MNRRFLQVASIIGIATLAAVSLSAATPSQQEVDEAAAVFEHFRAIGRHHMIIAYCTAGGMFCLFLQQLLALFDLKKTSAVIAAGYSLAIFIIPATNWVIPTTGVLLCFASAFCVYKSATLPKPQRGHR